MLKRSLWGVLGQGLNSLSSLMLTIMVARNSSPAEVGAWAIGYALYTFVLALSRSSISTTAIIVASDVNESGSDSSKEGDRQAVSAAVFFALVLALVISSVGLLFSGPIRFYTILFGVGLPILIWQDALRYVTIRKGNLASTALIDFVWLAGQIALGVALVTFFENGRLVTLGWLLAAVVSILVASVFASPVISLKRAQQFVSKNRSTSAGLFIEGALSAGVANVQPALLGLVVGLTATGYFRGALSLLGVVGTVVLGLTPIMTAEVVGLRKRSQGAGRLLVLWIIAIGGVGICVTAIVWWLPDRFGHMLLGDTWTGAATILPIVAAQVIFRGPSTGIPIVLRAYLKIRLVVKLRLFTSLLTLVITTLAASLHGLHGAAWGWLGSSMVICLIWAAAYYRLQSKEQWNSLSIG